jgi:hypothetical protein
MIRMACLLYPAVVGNFRGLRKFFDFPPPSMKGDLLAPRRQVRKGPALPIFSYFSSFILASVAFFAGDIPIPLVAVLPRPVLRGQIGIRFLTSENRS